MESFGTYAKAKLGERQKEINSALERYLESQFGNDAYSYHDSTAKAVDVFKDIVTRSAKRLRGSFVIEAYNMFKTDGHNDVINAAVAIELIHAYLLVIDDFNDKSDTRRGDPTAHKLHESYHAKQHLHGDSLHYGYSVATLSGLFGMHHASNLLLELNFPAVILIKAIRGVNDAINVTAYGQVRDIYNQQIPNATEHDVMEVHRLKTAHYTYFNPIQLGATLAGQADETIQKFKEYTEKAGTAFQIQDDILGVFGDPKDTGKSNMDDIMEGKATLLTVYARKKATAAQNEILDKAIGNRTLSPELFEKVQTILSETGSLDYSKKVAHQLVLEAKESMYQHFPDFTDNGGFKFITGIADYMIERKL
jgi:geranylgeranyl diphosphate synthase type I